MSKYGRLGVASPVITGCDTRWSLSVAKCNNKLQKEVYVSKLVSNNEIVAYNVRHEVTNVPLDNVIIKNVETKEYIVCSEAPDTWAGVQEFAVSPLTKNYSDAQDIIKVLASDPTLTAITPEGLTAIRSERGKRAWAKKKAKAEVSAE